MLSFMDGPNDFLGMISRVFQCLNPPFVTQWTMLGFFPAQSRTKRPNLMKAATNKISFYTLGVSGIIFDFRVKVSNLSKLISKEL